MFIIGKDCDIHPSVKINVNDGYIGEGSIIREGVIIEGTKVCIGREAYIDRFSVIGGGSCFDPDAYLVAGDWFHMGWNSQVNIACGVTIGSEVGLGIETKVFTHGAYIDSYNLGAPVQWSGVEIGDNVWIPNGWINPGVKIGSNVVIAARSLVNMDIPSGSLCGGIPARIINQNYYPKILSKDEKIRLINNIFNKIRLRFEALSNINNYILEFFVDEDKIICNIGNKITEFSLKKKSIDGDVSELAKVVKDQLRRNGIRFRYKIENNTWIKWKNDNIER